jgi:hypothetical protein
LAAIADPATIRANAITGGRRDQNMILITTERTGPTSDGLVHANRTSPIFGRRDQPKMAGAHAPTVRTKMIYL